MKNRCIALIVVFIIGLIIVGIVYNDSFLYKATIVKVTGLENKFSHEEEGLNGEKEKYYDQIITAIVLNGERKGEMVSLSNTYSSSGVNDERYHKGSQLFVSLKNDDGKGVILGKKRDGYIALFFVLFIFLLVMISGKHGGIVLISFVVNLALLLMALKMYDEYGNLLKVVAVIMILFSVITLLFAGGVNKKSIIAIISTLVTIALCYGIYMITMNTSERIPYEMMDYIVSPKDLADLFLAGTLMGSLGAVMDVSISIAAGVSEVVAKTPDISFKKLVNSIRQMGYDIMGTMINVLFFTYLSGTLPILVIKIKNGYTLYHLIKFQLTFESVCFLVGAIGIVLAIVVAGLLSAFFFGNRAMKIHGVNSASDGEVEG